MQAFRAAIEARDMEAAVRLLAKDVVFRSPVVFSPYEGRDVVAPILRAVAQVFEGCDFLHLDESGSIDEPVVMVRPLSAALALAEAMRARLTSLNPVDPSGALGASSVPVAPGSD